ncbi:aminoglycoside phosphotransferase [Bacillus cereus]|uniref:Aminoglycoside phosphotransferase n=1 Tax=Bacillus thuringiensis serovar kumamotoensis TaxID=132267 RepID=A0A9X6JKR6_BACUK|nr:MULTISPECIES: aminoglycoside phosphotransferase [Bacillus cereus group]MCU5668428.1 aminoglycoside phosphotransferase [Bacillus cereus]MEC2871610.1 aminoglycoside phosphotransferase [Bacillus cereus]OTZ68510.1 aminoglycoside phosphotransferase [Bacillus thuringiensis serovar kumamtoensis]TKH47704.1 aminoglycoside phosphotransferase [Bacillus cereus]
MDSFQKHFYIFDLAVPIYSAIEYSFAGNGNIIDYEHSITKALFEGYQEENELPKEMIDKFPLFIKLKEEQVRIMNLYRMKIENKNTYINI